MISTINEQEAKRMKHLCRKEEEFGKEMRWRGSGVEMMMAGANNRPFSYSFPLLSIKQTLYKRYKGMTGGHLSGRGMRGQRTRHEVHYPFKILVHKYISSSSETTNQVHRRTSYHQNPSSSKRQCVTCSNTDSPPHIALLTPVAIIQDILEASKHRCPGLEAWTLRSVDVSTFAVLILWNPPLRGMY